MNHNWYYNYRFFENSPYDSHDEVNYIDRLDIDELKSSLSLFMNKNEDKTPFVFSEVSEYFIHDLRGFFEQEKEFKQCLHDFKDHGYITIDSPS